MHDISEELYDRYESYDGDHYDCCEDFVWSFKQDYY